LIDPAAGGERSGSCRKRRWGRNYFISTHLRDASSGDKETEENPGDHDDGGGDQAERTTEGSFQKGTN
jgi:hypothetical protein